MENSDTNKKVKEEIKSTGDKILESRVNDIKTDPEFEYREQQLKKKMKNLDK